MKGAHFHVKQALHPNRHTRLYKAVKGQKWDRAVGAADAQKAELQSYTSPLYLKREVACNTQAISRNLTSDSQVTPPPRLGTGRRAST